MIVPLEIVNQRGELSRILTDAKNTQGWDFLTFLTVPASKLVGGTQSQLMLFFRRLVNEVPKGKDVAGKHLPGNQVPL